MTRVVGVCGTACAALALWQSGTQLGAMVWACAVIAACVGFGGAIAVAAKQRASLALEAIVGLAAMLAVSTGLARLGLLTRYVELGIVGAGLVACIAMPPVARQARRGAVGYAIAIGGILVAIAAARTTLLIGDGSNHVFVVKRLWDAGGLAVFHQVGAQLVGEAYFALAAGAQSVSIFDDGACAALLVWLLACEVGSRDDDFGIPLFIALATSVVLYGAAGEASGLWSFVLLHVSLVYALEGAIRARRVGWLVAPLALALMMLRHEYLVLGLPYLTAAFVLPMREHVDRRAAAIWFGLWTASLVVMQLGYHTPMWRVVLVWLAVPAAWAIVRLLGETTWRSAIAVGIFAALAVTLANAADVTSPSFQSPETLLGVWLAMVIAIAARVDRARGMQSLTVAVILALVVLAGAIETNLIDRVRDRVRASFALPISSVARMRALGMATDAQDDVHAVQAFAPRGATIAFWGQSAAHLDFGRNSITDVSWPHDRWRSDYFLSELHALPRTDYLIVEAMLGRSHPDPWGFNRPGALDALPDPPDLVATIGAARLYRVR